MSPRDKKGKAREAARRPKSSQPVQVSEPPPSDQAAGPAKPQEPTKLAEHHQPARRAEGVPLSEQVRPPAGNPPDWRVGGHQIWLDFRNGMLVALALVALKLVFEDTTFVKSFRLATYNVMQVRLGATSIKKLPVAVVDISDIRLVDTDVPGRQATPRAPLQHLLATIAKQKPRAIGIDIDFSPDEHGFLFRNDPEFFRFCLRLQRPQDVRIPVFLGVHRSDMLRPERWLDSEEFQELAVSITIPPDSRKMMESISITGFGRELPTMGAALAKAYRGGRHTPELRPRWVFRRLSEGSPSPAQFRVPEFYVDFGPLDALEEQTLRLWEADTKPVIVSYAKQPLLGKMVLLGNATREKALDQFNVPDRPETKAGVYLHTCAAYTLVTKPLSELTLRGALVLDLLLAALAFGTIAGIRVYYYKRTSREVATHKLEVILLTMLAAISALMGIWFVNRTRVMWEDSLLVAVALMVHRPVAIALHSAGRGLRAAWKDLIFEEANKKENHP